MTTPTGAPVASNMKRRAWIPTILIIDLLSSGRIVADPELTPVLPFWGYFCIDGKPLRTRFYWKNPSAHTPPSKQPNAAAIAIRTFMRRVPVGKSRLYSRCRRSVFDRYQPIGENCASFGKREFTSSTISMLASAPNKPQAADPTTAATNTITRGFMVEIVTGHSGQGGRECRLAIAIGHSGCVVGKPEITS